MILNHNLPVAAQSFMPIQLQPSLELSGTGGQPAATPNDGQLRTNEPAHAEMTQVHGALAVHDDLRERFTDGRGMFEAVAGAGRHDRD